MLPPLMQHGLSISSSTTCLGLCVLTALILVPLIGHRLEHLSRARVAVATILLAVAALSGARLHYLLLHWSYFREFPVAALRLTQVGYHAAGAILAVAAVFPFIAAGFRIPLGKYVDVTAVASGLSIAIARVGCFLTGCCFGTTCNYPWCVSYPLESLAFSAHRARGIVGRGALESAHVHPIALYFALSGLLISAIALMLYARKRYDGQVGLWCVATFALTTLCVELFRDDADTGVRWLGIEQRLWMAGSLCVLATAAIAWRRAQDAAEARLSSRLTGGRNAYSR